MSFLNDPGGGDHLDAKLAQLRADFGEDIDVYDYDDDGLMGTTVGLEEDMNDFNDETFGIDTVGKDFDFSGSTAQYLGMSEDNHQQKPQSGANWTTMPSLLAVRESSGSSAHQPSSSATTHKKDRPTSLLEDPLLAPLSGNTGSRNPTGQSTTPFKPNSSAPPTSIPKPSTIRTLEEIEEELRANSAAKKNISTSKLPPQVLTLEQVEAALLANKHQQKAANGIPSRTSSPFLLPHPQVSQPMRPQSVQQLQKNSNLYPAIPPVTRAAQPPMSLPALSHPAHSSHPQHSEWLRLQQQQSQMYTQVSPQQMQIQPLHSRLPALTNPHNLLNRQLHSQSAMGFSSSTATPHQILPSGAQTPFSQPSVNTIPVEELRSVAEARIQEQERQDALRRRKAAKIAEMSKYNNLMSQGDKDFITRIQVSQLVNPSHVQSGFDPYADDFYFHVYSALRASRVANQLQIQAANADRHMHPSPSSDCTNPDDDGMNGPGIQARNNRPAERRLTRRDYAMIRMAQNVQRIVDHAKERPKMSQVSLEGALGKISLRTRSAPRQMLQVQPSSSDDLTTAAGGENHPGALAGSLPKSIPTSTGQPALRRRQVLMSLERLYSIVLDVEQLRRTQPNLQSALMDKVEPNDQLAEWTARYTQQIEKIWKQLRVLDPLGISHPHPFVSLISVAKGKRVLPRVLRLFNREQSLQVLTLIVATFETLDVVSDAPLLDLPLNTSHPPGKRSRSELELETELFMNCVVATMMTVINGISLELVTGLVSLLMERNELMHIARSKAGIAFLTLFLSRAELLRSAPSVDSPDPNGSSLPSPEALSRWQSVFNQLFNHLSSDFPSLFPSTRAAAALPQSVPHSAQPDSPDLNGKQMRPGIDLEDEPVWQLMAALAVSTDAEGQQTLVGGLRGKVLENVIAASRKTVPDEIGVLKIKNVNLMLHALGLDASMIKL